MFKPLYIMAFASFFVFSPVSAQADIFVGSDNNNSSSGGSIFLDRSPTSSGSGSSKGGSNADRPIFVNPTKSGTKRQLPNYAITNTNTSRKEVVGFGSAAEKLQASKLREARVQSRYKKNRNESINLQTLPEQFARQFKGTSISDLTDFSAYNAALAADINARQALNENSINTESGDGPAGSFGSVGQQTIQKSNQLAAQSQSKSDELARESQQQNGGVTNPNNVMRGRNNRTYIP